ncbi:MAG: response regulator transcription factor [bacterium]|nr:response regulator transcription factor [bacterium]
MRILIIEDEESLAKLIKDGLVSEGFAVDYILDGETGQTRIELCHDDYDLIILDLMLPKRSGLEICKFARDNKITTPILMLTAKDGAEDIIGGLNVGADDYLTKPFSFQVLLARIRAILRRPKAALPLKLKAQNLTLDIIGKQLFKDDKEIKLTLKEFNLLEYLMRNPNRVLTREQILSNVWDFSFDSFSNVVDVHITNLRKKLDDKNSKLVKTIHGVGYQLSA